MPVPLNVIANNSETDVELVAQPGMSADGFMFASGSDVYRREERSALTRTLDRVPNVLGKLGDQAHVWIAGGALLLWTAIFADWIIKSACIITALAIFGFGFFPLIIALWARTSRMDLLPRTLWALRILGTLGLVAAGGAVWIGFGTWSQYGCAGMQLFGLGFGAANICIAWITYRFRPAPPTGVQVISSV